MAPAYRAQLALLVAEPPSGSAWLHEIKLDGYRIGILIERGHVRLLSRRGTDWTSEFPELVAAAKRLRTRGTMIDGEVVMLSERGISNFEALQNRRRGGTLAYFAFDVMHLDGRDLSKQPLVERKRALRALIGKASGLIRYTEHFDDAGPLVLRRACELGAEGIVSKRRDAPYRWGARHSDWQKSKCSKRQEFVVGGFTDPSGSRVGVGSILVGYYEGDALRFAGKVGTGPGWTARFGTQLREKLERISVRESPFTPRPPGWLGRNAHWVKPKYVVEVEFTEWTAGGNVRHPSLQGFRTDKAPREVVRELPVASAGQRESRAATKAVSSPLIFAKPRIRRADLVTLYSEIADWALPHVQRRPLTVVRCRGAIVRDDALRAQCTFVRHTARDNAFAPATVPRTRIQEKKKVGEYLYVDGVDALLALIEHGVVEWHTWNACVDDVELPDRVVFDLDPGERTAFAQVVTAARLIRRALDGLGLDSWVKTTGGRGLHVVVPFRPEHSWNAVFEFSRQVAEALATQTPARYTTSFAKGDRTGRVLIDYKRNYRTSIAVAGFSIRARPLATMSVPLSWSEVTARLDPTKFTVSTIRKRLSRLRRDPWEGYWGSRQRLPIG